LPVKNPILQSKMENKKTLKIGRSDFDLIIKNNHYFVDKTMLIYDFHYSANDILLMPRPKRFGKTLNLSMIDHFFDIQKPKSAQLFSEFEISKHEEFCKTHQNKYPVINITLKNIKEATWEKCLERFKSTISKMYKEYRFLLQSDKLEKDEKQYFENILSESATEIKFKESLLNLSNYLHKHFGEKVIILVDEYDTPIINAYKHTSKPIKRSKEEMSYYQNVVDFMQSFLGDAFKGNDDNLQKGLITGVMRVARESIFSDWNNFSVYGITSTYFSDKFGFTQKETEEILTYFGYSEDIPKVEKWYDGYQFGNTHQIYNPWSIVNYISNRTDGFKSYWVNSSDDSLIKERITETNIKDKVEDLVAGKIIQKTIRENFVFSDFEHQPELLWTFLFHNGFLTMVSKNEDNQYELKIPNYELRFVFKDLILNWIESEYKYNRDVLITTSKHLINNNIPEFETGFKQIIGDTFSYFDTAEVNSITKEQIFHVYTLGLLAVLCDDYIIKSNRESGEGRYDILLVPHDKTKNGVVIEFKSIEKQKENEEYETFQKRIDNEIDKALQQIERNKYYKELIAHEIPLEQIVKVPIVFAGKEPYITKQNGN